MAKSKKRIGVAERLTMISQAIVEYSKEGGDYMIESEPGAVAIVLIDVELSRAPDHDGELPAYRLIPAAEKLKRCANCDRPISPANDLGGPLCLTCHVDQKADGSAGS